jgi:hypothetical protein
MNSNLKKVIIGGLVITSSTILSAQNIPMTKVSDGIKVPCVVVDGDTLPSVTLSYFVVSSEMIFPNKRKKEQWDRMKYNVRIVLPLARTASSKLNEYEITLRGLPDERSREKFLDKAEEELKRDFEKKIKGLSFNQGMILIKLIDRETGNTSYDLVKKLRGSFSAFMWQGMARLFGSNLKSEYDSEGEDKLIEMAVNQIENE